MSGRPMPSHGDFPCECKGSVGAAGASALADGEADASSNGLGRPDMQELQDVLRRDWAVFSQKLEERLQEQFHRQAIRVEHLVAGRVGPDGIHFPHFPHAAKVHDQQAETDHLLQVQVDECVVSAENSQTMLEGRQLVIPSSSSAVSNSVDGNDRAQTPNGDAVSGNRTVSRRSNSVEDVAHAILSSLGKPKNSRTSEGVQSYISEDEGHSRTFRKAAYARFNRWIDRWVSLEEPPKRSRLAAFVDGKGFELVCALVIVANSAMTVRTTNHEAATLTDDTSVPTKVLSIAFVLFYSVELILKLYVHRVYFFVNTDMSWNIFDFVLVAFALYDVVVSEIMISHSGPNLSYMRTMRVLRLAKILRVVRVMRFFAELRLILNSVLGSVVSLFWSIVMLALMFFIFALVFVQGATSTLQNLSDNAQKLTEVSEELDCISSVQAAMLMLYQATTGGEDWKNFYRSVRHTGDLNCALFLFFVAFAQFALLNILTGIFVENAMKLAQPDRDTLALHKRKEDVSEADELRRLCKSMDHFKTGFIDEEQFVQQLKSNQFKARLAVLGLDIRDAELFFRMIASEFDNGQVEIEAFVAGCMRLKGLASSLDLQTLMFGTKLIHANQLRFQASIEEQLNMVLESVRRNPRGRSTAA